MLKKYRKDFIILFGLIIVGTLMSWFQGNDSCWDLANYKIYGVWALLHNRIGYDIMPCGIQSYFNPLIDFPLYFYVKYFNNHPYFISFLQSISWGITVFLVYKIANLLFKDKYKNFFIILSVFIGATSMLSVAEVGMSYDDVPVCALILFSLYLFFKFFRAESSQKRNYIIFLSSWLFGISTGLKFSGFIQFVGFFVAFFCLYKKITEPKKTIFLLLMGYIIGYTLSGLWWYMIIYNKFGNPVFPLMNNIFHSEYALPISHADLRHLPSDIFQFLFYPFYWVRFRQNFYVFELENIDFRPVFVYISTILTFFTFLKTKIQDKKSKLNEINLYTDIDILLFLNIFLLVTYVIWINNSSILRYIILFEFLSGLYILGFVSAFIKNHSYKKVVSILILIFLLISTRYADPCASRIQLIDKFINSPNLKFPDNSVVCFIGGYPYMKFVPFQNPNVRYVNLYSEMYDYNFVYPPKYEKKVQEIINQAGRNVFLVYANFEPAVIGYDYIARFVNIDDFECSPLENVYGIDYHLCKFKDLK